MMKNKNIFGACAKTIAALGFAFASTPAMADNDEAEIALLSFLGLEAAQGEVKIEDAGGELETLILSTYMLRHAGKLIADQSTASRVLLLDRDDRYDVSKVGLVRSRLDMLDQQIVALESLCRSVPVAQKEGAFEGADLSTQAILNAIGGLVKTDITYSNIDATLGDTMLINAVASNGAGKFALPSEIATTDQALSQRAGELKFRLDQLGANECIKGENNANIKTGYDAAVALYTTLTEPGSKQGPSLIEAADFAAGLVSDGTKILRVEVIKAGGSVVERNNLLTIFGKDPITISGGLIATYRLIDPATGGVEKSGNILCRTRARGVGRINGGTLRREGVDLRTADNCIKI